MTTKLQLKFGTMTGEKTWNFNYAKSNASTSAIKNLMQVMIDNGSIYANPPMTMRSAKLITTTETAIDIS